MKYLSKLLTLLFLLGYGFTINAQTALPVTGGNSVGSGGTVSYTIGQVFYLTLEGTSGSIAQGVQQPYEISVLTSIGNTDGIVLDYRVYPNPTDGLIKLIVKPFDNGHYSFCLYDLNGMVLKNRRILSEESEISMVNLYSAIYFLRILKDNKELKVFKIIKK